MAQKQDNGRRFKDAAALREACDQYFDTRDRIGAVYSEPGLLLDLGISETTWDNWWEGRKCPDLMDETRRACLRIADCLQTHPAYMDKGGMTTKAIFLMKQKRMGGYQDKVESRQDMTVNIKMDTGTDESDFK